MNSLDREAASSAAEQLRVFAQPQRLMILSALLDIELSVGAIDAATGIGQPALSQQLAELRRAEFVAQRRVAKQVLYRLADERMASIVRFISTVLGRNGEPAEILQTLGRPQTKDSSGQSAAMFAVMDQ